MNRRRSEYLFPPVPYVCSGVSPMFLTCYFAEMSYLGSTITHRRVKRYIRKFFFCA